MGNHSEHNDHNSNEKKPVAFTVPLIFASVVVLVIVLLISIGDPSHGCECKETCSKECKEAHEKGDHSKCEAEMCDTKEGHGAEANKNLSESEDTMSVETDVPSATTDSTETAHSKHSEHH